MRRHPPIKPHSYYHYRKYSRSSYVDPLSDSALPVIIGTDQTPVQTSERFFHPFVVRRALMPRYAQPILSPDQESAVAHLRSQLGENSPPADLEVLALANHPDFPPELIPKLLALFHLS